MHAASDDDTMLDVERKAPNPARTAAVKGGVPTSVRVFTINMACPSGMKSAMLAAHELRAEEAHATCYGGMELMRTMPYLLKGARWEGFRSGDKTLMDCGATPSIPCAAAEWA